mmetsp:Transcript_12623/g.16996  ORF Transcript_12623/g.16996 Transcript_12623/m.16996 type:complete len:150 (+) Transcript_12623:84-533(+)|eukprot:CAMPEP_0197345786 /NCGR_PEP_ID=MMETSP0893-20130614/4605_1 /TAXON_ID=44058 ORGANISM="Aureoumbra lagunensis, Strain CCMP1510" /NCGR_SAMPLE_ID=MMETSP0893 /ASSEMBLY_ACC=CAM_ASM_000539 /LENGTH=149 /DNA_ID=CAMNT_0042853973 /DNA_START=89 /DNA_END=534 /DNA_ORIENTATION=-
MPKRTNELGQLRKEEAYEALESTVEEAGVFKRASEETIKKRRIVKARRPPPASPLNSENPFANVMLGPKAPLPNEKEEEESPPLNDVDLNEKETNRSEDSPAIENAIALVTTPTEREIEADKEAIIKSSKKAAQNKLEEVKTKNPDDQG